MDIQQMIHELNVRLEEENARLKEQEKVVEDLGNRYSEQSAILKVIKSNIKSLSNSIVELNRNQAPGRDAKLPKELLDDRIEHDEEYIRLTKLLNEAVDIGVRIGLFADEVMTKTGTTMSLRRSIINRARNSILRYCGTSTAVDWIRDASDKDICDLRNVGKKTQEVIKIARSIINGKEVKRGDFE